MEYIKSLTQIDKNDLEFAGGKGANLGEMVKVGLPVPEGFVVGVAAYFDFLAENKLEGKISRILTTTNLDETDRLLDASLRISKIIKEAKIPDSIQQEIKYNYQKLNKVKVAVRSSATAEDLPEASFAGQQATFLNVSSEKQLLEKVRECWASLFTARAIFYREQNNFNHLKVGLAVVVQKMIESDVSGVMFTVDPITNDKNVIVIEAAFGLGEFVVGGQVTPDQYQVEKDNLTITSKKIVNQEFQLVEVKGENKKIPVSRKFANSQKLPDSKILELAKYGKLIENHYYFSQDIEWALESNKLYILQTRPITTLTEKETQVSKDGVLKSLTSDLKLILEGIGASPGIAFGPVKIIKSAAQIGKIKPGDILVTGMTNPDFVPAMKKSKAIVTDRGGRTSHAAIVSRELGIPAVVGTNKATAILKNGVIITVDGIQGKVYLGAPKTNGKVLDYRLPALSNKPITTVTKIYVNLAEPEKVAEVAKLPVDGVGLLRAEFMIAGIGVHPKYAIAQKQEKEFIKKMAQNLVKFAQNFAPRPVIYRASDFKTNEYYNLKGGEKFEAIESNPLIGFRGAVRFLAQPEVLSLELKAIEKVYRVGLDNLKLMIPYVRTLEELKKIKQFVENSPISKNPNFELWMMVEVPSNVLILEDFLEVGVDGVSIGSNDLTMLILGVDRDNEQLAQSFTETDPAVLVAFEKIIKTCKKFNVPCSICGQAPQVFDDLVRKLVTWGINSISVSPDTVERVRQLVADTERELVLNGKNSRGYDREVRDYNLK